MGFNSGFKGLKGSYTQLRKEVSNECSVQQEGTE